MDTTPSATPQYPPSSRDQTPPPLTTTDSDVSPPSSNVPQLNQINHEGQNKVFTCTFCMKSFGTSQALGGHQNAHRQERHFVRTINAMHEESQPMLLGHQLEGLRPPFGIRPQNTIPWQQLNGSNRSNMPGPPQCPAYRGPLFDGQRFSLGLNYNNNSNDLSFDVNNPWHHFAKVPSWKSRATEQRLAYEFRPYTQTYRGPRRNVQDGGTNRPEQGNKQPPMTHVLAHADDNVDEELDLTLRL